MWLQRDSGLPLGLGARHLGLCGVLVLGTRCRGPGQQCERGASLAACWPGRPSPSLWSPDCAVNGAGPTAVVAQGSSDVAELREAPLGRVPTARRRCVGDLQTQRAGQHGRGLGAGAVSLLCSPSSANTAAASVCSQRLRCPVRQTLSDASGWGQDTWLPARACLCGQRGTCARPTVSPLHGSMGSRTAEMSLLPEPRPRRAQTFLSPPVPRAGRPGHLCTHAGGVSSCQPVDGRHPQCLVSAQG